MQSPPVSNTIIPLRSPTPPSSSDDLNDLDQELARLDDVGVKRPHFLDYDPVPPADFDSIQLPFQPSATDPLTNGAQHTDDAAKLDTHATGTSTKKHFLDENPIPPDYDYGIVDFEQRHHRSLDREYDRNGRNEIHKAEYERRHSIERAKQQEKPKDLTYASLSWETNDARGNDADRLRELLDKKPEYVSMAATGRLGSKVDCVYSLLSVIGRNQNDSVDLSGTFLELSTMPGSSKTLRGCISWLVSAIHMETDEVTRKQARQALHNMVQQQDDKAGRREAKLFRHIEQIMDYCDALKQNNKVWTQTVDGDSHPLQAMSSLVKVSFDQDHRHVMCYLGALQSIAAVVQCDHAAHGSDSKDPKCISLRRYAAMALTNLTFGDGNNKALLCANKEFMKALVAQIETDADDLLQVTANVLRNLSWRADRYMKTVLSEIGTVTALTKAAMRSKNENTLRAVMSALWNLSAHSSENKDEVLMVDGALTFLVEMLTYDAPSKTWSIVENAGGILSNVSSHIAVNEDFRRILRQRNCLGILLQQLKSESLTVVSNACGMLWNLSARCPEDQNYLRANGAVPMLRSLINSKHKMISNGSKAALKNLVNCRGGELSRSNMDPVAKMIGLKELPTLNVRKQRALEAELDQNLSETCENLDDKTPPSGDKSINDFIGHRKTTDTNHSNVGVDHSSVRVTVDSERNVRMPSKSAFAVTDETFERKSITGTIPKRTVAHHSSGDADTEQISIASNTPSSITSSASSSATVVTVKAKAKHPEGDMDQITNFALLDDENHDGNKIVVDEDSTKCYDNEGTPHTVLSSAASVSDLRTPTKNQTMGVNKHLKSGRNTTDNSGINTPEKPIFYCEEGTPMCFSHHDSFSSLDEEHPENVRDALKTQPKPLAKSEDHVDVSESVPISKSVDATMPPSPGAETAETVSKSVKFNEFLETPMMFSRQSSMESLSDVEPALADDRSSVVSEISRMPSGIISPSELPDSPSQTMPPSPRHRRTDGESSHHHTDNAHGSGVMNGVHRVPFEEEQVKTYVVENTPAYISCATSLSNLSFDEETKITTDSLLKEMRLMHQMSDEQEDLVVASTSKSMPDALTTNDETKAVENASHDDVPSDSDDSVNDSDLLAKCINIGMKSRTVGPSQSIPSDKVAVPPLELPMKLHNDDQSSCDEDDDDLILQKCINIGMKSRSTGPKSITSDKVPANCDDNDIDPIRLKDCHDLLQPSTRSNSRLRGQVPSVPENPIRMMRKGGNTYIAVADETNRFNVEDSPCNFSVMSGLSDLTIATKPYETTRLPTTQENANTDRSLSPTSVDSEEDRILLNRTIVAGIQSNVNSHSRQPVLSQQASTSNSVSIPATPDPHYNESNHSLSSIDSTDSNTQNGELLQNRVKRGKGRSVPPKQPVQQPQPQRRTQLPQFKAAGPSHVRDVRLVRDTNDDVDSNHSFSSIDSSDSNVNDRELLQQVINVGMRRTQLPHSKADGPSHVRDHRLTRDANDDVDSNHSFSSIDSSDSNVNDRELLQQVIKVGMRQEPAPPKPPVQLQQQSRRSHLPQFKVGGPSQARDHRLTRERKDEQLLLDCINAGIESIRLNSNENAAPSLPPRRTYTAVSALQPRGQCDESPIIENSKNSYATSAAVLGSAGATSMGPGVVMSHREGTITESERDQHRLAPLAMDPTTVDGKIIIDRTVEQPAQPEIGYSICSSTTSALNASFMSIKSRNSFTSAHDSSLLEQSNESPAMFRVGDGISDSDNSPSMEMDVSNECLFENLSPKKMDKHKDPDLMLQSVERLTRSFVSTAEYLRTGKTFENGDIDDDDDDDDDDTSTLAEDKKSFSASNNTWNDEVNDVSFPSISRSAPIIASMKDDDTSNSDTNHGIKFDKMTKSLEPLEESTPTNESRSIVNGAECNGQLHFDIGGQINQFNFTDIRPNYTYGSSVNSFDTNSTLTNSTIIAMEANKIRTELMNNGDRTDSTISLDKIRPPSAMDKLSFCEPLSQSPSSLKTSGKYLTQGFMARRALNNTASAHGSMDSINSSLDRVKPPSLMDDLLDSMISVDSIASEFVDAPLQHEDPSNYETALSECDDMTMTLKNCAELPMDSTPCGSDFSSVESTPKKSRRSLTPRRKRQLTRDRYQTYTIVAENKDGPQSSNSGEDGQFMQIHDSDNTLLLNDDTDAISLVSTDDGEMSSIRALTKKLTYLQDINTNTYTKKSSERFTELNKTSTFRPERTAPKQNESLTNGQTEPQQHQAAVNKPKSPRIVIPTVNGKETSSITNSDQNEAAESKAIRGRKKPAYVSPYKMTKLAKPAAKPVTPPVIKPVTTTTLNKTLSPRTAIKPTSIKSSEPTKTPSPSIARAKSLIQRSAESLRKIRPAITSKLTKQNSLSPTSTTAPQNSPDEKMKLSRQKSDDTAHSSGSSTLIRQNTFTKDEPSANEIPVISSEPTSPKKTSKIATKIPFNRSVSATVQRNVTKCQTNIEIPLQKSAANVKRNMKSATSASHIMTPSSFTSRQSPKVEQKPMDAENGTGRNIFKRFSPLQKSNSSIQSKLPSANGKIEVKPSTSGSSISFKSKIAATRFSYAAK